MIQFNIIFVTFVEEWSFRKMPFLPCHQFGWCCRLKLKHVERLDLKGFGYFGVRWAKTTFFLLLLKTELQSVDNVYHQLIIIRDANEYLVLKTFETTKYPMRRKREKRTVKKMCRLCEIAIAFFVDRYKIPHQQSAIY